MNNKKNIIKLIILICIITTPISVYATYDYFAKDVSYTKKDGTEISVEQALNELYQKKSNELIYKFGTNNKDSGIETIKIEHDCENALIVTGQTNLQFSINSTDDFKGVTLLGYNENGMGFYYANVSLKKEDIMYIRRNTIYAFGYVIVY